MAIQKAEAFVLRTQPFRTSSLIVTTFTRPFGKIKGVVKGVRREGIARPGTFEPFTLLEIVFYEKIHSELHLISEAEILESFEPLRTNLSVLATAYYLAELVDQLTEPHDPHEPIFELVDFAFRFLPSLPPFFMARFFEIRLLHEIGLLPHLEGCLVCGEKNAEPMYFSARQGAIFCLKCRGKSPESKLIRGKVLEAIRFFIEQPVTEAARYALSGETEKEMGELIERFLNERLPRRLATRRFLNQVKSLTRHSLDSIRPDSIHKA